MHNQSIKAHAQGFIPPPDLASAQRVSVGAGLYTEMFSGCRPGLGIEKSEMSQGIYPQAPELAIADRVGEFVDHRLIDGDPVEQADLLADRG